MRRDELTGYLDGYLEIAKFEDSAWNGLQVEGDDAVDRVAVAVDASLETIERSVEAGCQMLLVHHGLYWGQGFRIIGADRRKVARLIEGRVSLYGAHLPLDAHPEVGNNVEILRRLAVAEIEPWGRHRGVAIGARGRLRRATSLARLARRIERALETRCRVFDFGGKPVAEVGVISGAGGFGVVEAARTGVDVLVTGEWDYSRVGFARDHGVSVIVGGHYRTETVGVQCLARHLHDRFGLGWVWIDAPVDL